MDGFAGIKEVRDGVAVHGDDAALHVVFKREAIQNKVKSDQAGRPIFDEFDFVEITVPGGKTKVIEKVKDHHKMRFPRHWELYQKQMNGHTGEALIGTPLDQWPAMTKARVFELRALGIHTVDQLANLSDQGIALLGIGGRELKAKAAAYLAQATNNSEYEDLAAENVRLAEEITMLKQQMQDMAAMMQSMKVKAEAPADQTPELSQMPQQLMHPVDTPSEPFIPQSLAHSNLSTLTEVQIPEHRRRGRPPKQG